MIRIEAGDDDSRVVYMGWSGSTTSQMHEVEIDTEYGRMLDFVDGEEVMKGREEKEGEKKKRRKDGKCVVCGKSMDTKVFVIVVANV